MEKGFGLLGCGLSHSLSPKIHQKLGQWLADKMLCSPYSYVLFDEAEDQLDAFFGRRVFSGLNVTIPYKKKVLAYCSVLSEKAARLQSVNTICVRPDGSLYGHNTDYYGFCYMSAYGGISFSGRLVLVLGSGGVSSVVSAAARDLGAGEVIIVSRRGPVNYENVVNYSQADILINTTPVGMYPRAEERLVDLDRFPCLSGVMDLIYNPAETLLLKDAAARGIPFVNGLSMLVAQAKESAEYFTGCCIDESVIADIIRTIY